MQQRDLVTMRGRGAWAGAGHSPLPGSLLGFASSHNTPRPTSQEKVFPPEGGTGVMSVGPSCSRLLPDLPPFFWQGPRFHPSLTQRPGAVPGGRSPFSPPGPRGPPAPAVPRGPLSPPGPPAPPVRPARPGPRGPPAPPHARLDTPRQPGGRGDTEPLQGRSLRVRGGGPGAAREGSRYGSEVRPRGILPPSPRAGCAVSG